MKKVFKTLTILLLAAASIFTGCKNLQNAEPETEYCTVTVSPDNSRSVITSQWNISDVTEWTLTVSTEDGVFATDTKADYQDLSVTVKCAFAYDYELTGVVTTGTTSGIVSGTVTDKVLGEDTTIAFTVKPILATDTTDSTLKGVADLTFDFSETEYDPVVTTNLNNVIKIVGKTGNAAGTVVNPEMTLDDKTLTYTGELPTGIYEVTITSCDSQIQKKYFAVEAGLKTPVSYVKADLDDLMLTNNGFVNKKALVFKGSEEFTLNVDGKEKVWTGNLYYSTDGSTWNTWGGEVITAGNIGSNYYLFLRGKTDELGKMNLLFGSDDIPVAGYGNIMNLVDYEDHTKPLGEWGFYGLFKNCVALTTAPALTTTTLVDYCYSWMFYNCTNLTQAPALPATTLADYSYSNMFHFCKSLITAPALPATTLAIWCYDGMFNGCTSLTQAPVLPATTLADSCYQFMFYDCTSLTQAPALPATTLTYKCYDEMFFGCTSLTQAPALPATTLANSCYYEMFRGCTSLTQAPALPATTLTYKCYDEMFYGCTSLTAALVLPATTLADSCYYEMFRGCASLTQAPALPATTLADSCYYEMFRGCTSLTQAPVLPATTLADSCYQHMFLGCTSLTQAPALPATTLTYKCYDEMFFGCTSLSQAPALPATTLVQYCYYAMFYDCTSLIQPPALPATTLASYCYYKMFYRCTSLTQAPALPATTLKSYCYEEMFYNCTSLKIATTGEESKKILTTPKMSSNYYQNMFSGTAGTFTGTPYSNTTYYYY